MSENLNIRNRKAYHEYEIMDKFTAGLSLTGTEIKSIRAGKASIAEGYCYLKQGEMWIRNMHIAEYKQGNIYNHEPLRERKLLLNKRELRKIENEVKTKGITLIPLSVFISDTGFAKMQFAIARGKKHYDKRQSLKEKDAKREIDRTQF
ncbi:MAG: SsrA-binding protein SmpB [Bacteroidia bacterium]